jgi:hypothetical protein
LRAVPDGRERERQARRSNADLKIWGQTLMAYAHVGAIRLPSVPHVSAGGQPDAADAAEYGSFGDHSTRPAPHLPVTAMDDQLLVGAFRSHNASLPAGHLMVVDLRAEVVNASAGQKPTLGPRTVTLQIHAACTPTIVDGHAEGWSADVAPRHAWHAANRSLRLGLVAGGGALVRLRGCEEPLDAVRQWYFNPRAISLRPPNRLRMCPDLSSKAATFNRNGAANRNFAPGGLAGWTSSFVIGGSYWEEPRGFAGPRAMEEWGHAGFSMASVASDDKVRPHS